MGMVMLNLEQRQIVFSRKLFRSMGGAIVGMQIRHQAVGLMLVEIGIERQVFQVILVGDQIF